VQNNLDEYHHHINKNVSSDNPGPKTSYGPRAVKAYDSDAGHNLNRLFGPKVNFFPSSYLIYYLSKDVFFSFGKTIFKVFLPRDDESKSQQKLCQLWTDPYGGRHQPPAEHRISSGGSVHARALGRAYNKCTHVAARWQFACHLLYVTVAVICLSATAN
jgi:hypothetical protein